MDLGTVLEGVKPLDQKICQEAWNWWDTRCKPLRGFGRLEELVVQLAGIQRTVHPSCKKRAIVIMGADNGVVAEGVSQCGSEVTAQVLENMGQGITSVCRMAEFLGAQVFPVNIGMNVDGKSPLIRNCPVRYGTGNIVFEPAMTREECVRAIEEGIRIVGELKEQGYDLLLTGEMGIGNTTTSSACAAALFGKAPEEVTGRGAGLSSEGLERKVQVIRRALQVNQPDPSDPLDVIAKVGGLDIAGLAGVFLGGALCHTPVLVDGFISSVAALVAARLCPACKDYMLGSHASEEPASRLVLSELGLRPFLYAGMRLGEGTGAVAVMPLLDMGLAVYREMATFEDTNIEAYQPLG